MGRLSPPRLGVEPKKILSFKTGTVPGVVHYNGETPGEGALPVGVPGEDAKDMADPDGMDRVDVNMDALKSEIRRQLINQKVCDWCAIFRAM